MRTRFLKWLVVSALVVATGSHWVALQWVAWVGMFLEFSQTAPVMVALEKPFDGRHPCHLGKAVQGGKQSEKKRAMQTLKTKLDFGLPRHASHFSPPPQPFSIVPSKVES